MDYRSREVDFLFSDRSTIKRYLEVEKALAQVQGNLGMIPKEAADAIRSGISVHDIDIEKYNKDFQLMGFPIVGLVKQMSNIVPDGYGEYVHWGATTQDIMDTGLVLTLKEVIALFREEINSLIQNLATLASAHTSTLMVGRSQLQQAIPITFGYKVAGWLAPVMRHRERLRSIEERLLQVQFGGAVGTLASLGESGLKVKKALADNLDLGNPVLAWHTQRDNLTDLMACFSMLTGSLSKIAQDILFMTQSEIGELSERGGGKSSTMPQKRNPIVTQNVLVAGKHARLKLQGMVESMTQDHERGSATWQVEWSLIPDISSNSFFALQSLNKLLGLLEVNKDRMLANLQISDSLIYAESVMMKLAPVLGRQRAHDLVDEAVSDALSGVSFSEALKKIPKIADVLSDKDIEDLFSGKIHLDMAKLFTNQLLASIDRKN